MISIIVAMSKNRVIGKDNQIPWHLPEDLKRFKQITTGHAILMGRKTFESIGKPLPGRANIVITRDRSWQKEGVVVAHSIQEAIQKTNPNDESFIIGGAEIYREALPLADKVYLTVIDKDFEGDVFFPEINPSFQITSTEGPLVSEKQRLTYSNLILTR